MCLSETIRRRWFVGACGGVGPGRSGCTPPDGSPIRTGLLPLSVSWAPCLWTRPLGRLNTSGRLSHNCGPIPESAPSTSTASTASAKTPNLRTSTSIYYSPTEESALSETPTTTEPARLPALTLHTALAPTTPRPHSIPPITRRFGKKHRPPTNPTTLTTTIRSQNAPTPPL